MNEVETRLRVRYAETDQMGIVYYANYLIWMEVGRVELCRACGFNYRDMEEHDGILLAVAEANCRYASPARYDDEVTVRSWVHESHAKMVTFRYEMRVGQRRIASGFTRHVFLNREMRPTRLPEKYLRLFAGAAAQAAGRGEPATGGAAVRS
jgi:acyl-CoA thioester hydrolase